MPVQDAPWPTRPPAQGVHNDEVEYPSNPAQPLVRGDAGPVTPNTPDCAQGPNVGSTMEGDVAYALASQVRPRRPQDPEGI